MRRASIDRVNAKYLGGSAAYVGAPVVATSFYPHYIRSPVIAAPVVHGGLTRSIVNPPVYEIVEHQPVVEAVTTPGRVYEIVTPIVEVAPEPIRIPRRGCPWWCWMLLGLLFLLLLLLALAYLFREELGFAPVGVVETDQPESLVVAGGELKCRQGQHLVNGKCLSCPEGSTWNGSQCIKRTVTEESVDTTETKPQNEGKKEQEENKSHLRFNSNELCG